MTPVFLLLAAQLATQWTTLVDPLNPLPDYPRPQMTRPDWRNLNGKWRFHTADRSGEILVPFAIESALSGVGRPLKPSESLTYIRAFRIPAAWQGRRVVLHFGAVDWHATVRVNGQLAGEHKGGFTPFFFDITPLLGKPEDNNRLEVTVTDPTDSGTQPRGKQTTNPRGIWYTSVSGIWQTVWLEPVAETHIARLVPKPDLDHNQLAVHTDITAPNAADQVEAIALDGTREIARARAASGQPLVLTLKSPKPWSPENPKLYNLKVSILRDGKPIDAVSGYFAMRKISIGPDAQGRTRILLNNKPYFQMGPLDQGWWPDGLYTAPTDAALKSDIEYTKRIGLNLIRKHVKVEPARWYHHCDQLGILVWQDMPNGNLPNSLLVRPGDTADAPRPADSAAQFETELKELIRSLEMFPSIVTWVPFNEGWGQYDTARIAQLTAQLDPTRLVNSVSGWTDRNAGHMRDVHHYPGPAGELPGPGRAMVLGEFGGLSMPVEGHLWTKDANWGYATRRKKEELFAYYQSIFRNMHGLLAQGLSAAIYTQTTDVESEVNGYLTYDRAVEKFDAAALKSFHQQFYKPAPKSIPILPDARDAKDPWQYTFTSPTAETAWKTGPGAFLSARDGIFTLGTQWEGPSIWIRRDFTVSHIPKNIYLTLINGFTEGEVTINGQPVLQLKDLRPARRHHTHFDITAHRRLFRKGTNTIAIRANQPQGPRALDAGLYGVN